MQTDNPTKTADVLKTVDQQERFAFGKNWSRFLKHLTEDRIQEAEKSLSNNLGVQDLKGKTFLDIGSGSGLFSLAAHRLGATVFSFDYDQDSVACTQYLKKQYGNQESTWSVQQGSVLDQAFLAQFGQVDILYSWGVLHHTGNMMQAFENVAVFVKEHGFLFVSIYNDQGKASKRWKWIKERYNRSGFSIKFLLLLCCLLRLWACTVTKDFLRSGNPLKTWVLYQKNNRGMSAWYDLIDWVGGYPFEVATPEVVFDFFKKKGFNLLHLKTCAGGLGCNEFVFRKVS